MHILNRLKSLSRSKKVGLGIATIVVAAGAASASSSPEQPQTRPKADTPPITQTMIETQAPEITTAIVVETEDIPFPKSSQPDSGLERGRTDLRVAGVNGLRTLRYEVSYQDGAQTHKRLLDEQTTKAPITEVSVIGTKLPPPPRASANCHPSYTGACVPVASDVDCAGGSGNGPAYVSGPVTVVGADAYDLDGDGDGTGCDS